MSTSSRLRWISGTLLSLTFSSWIVALGGLGAINWYGCSDTVKTLESLAVEAARREPATARPLLLAAGAVAPTNALGTPFIVAPVANQDNAICSRSYRWNWWTLFFQFAIMASAAVATAMPKCLARARFPLAFLLSASSVLIMVAINNDINWVWSFYDVHRLFAQWNNILQRLYMSASALLAGWIMTVIFNLAWISLVLDAEVKQPATADGSK